MAMSAYTAGGIVTSVVSEALKAEGRPDRLTRMHTVTAVLTLGSMLALAPVGLTAVAAGMSIGALGARRVRGAPGARYLGADLRDDRRRHLAAGARGAGDGRGGARLEHLPRRRVAGTMRSGAGAAGGEGLVGVGIYLACLRLCAPARVRRDPAGARACSGSGSPLGRCPGATGAELAARLLDARAPIQRRHPRLQRGRARSNATIARCSPRREPRLRADRRRRRLDRRDAATWSRRSQRRTTASR